MKKICTIVLAGLFLACVDHRPIRNGLRDEAVYLDKAALTAPNPKLPAEAAKDDAWLMKVTVVKASAPNGAGDYAFPGFQSDTQVVKFRFGENALQLLDARSLQRDDPNVGTDSLSTQTDRVLMEFAGGNVDIKLRENLDGERTNYLEENTEEPWQKRQKFKVDLEKTSLDPITTMAWFYGEFLHDCVRPVSQNTVPGSFEWDPEDQYMSWVVEANYVLTVNGGCYDMVNLASGAGTATIQYRLSFYRPGPTNYVPEVIAEKDPVNKKYGSFQVLNLFRDSKTGLLSAKSLIQRWNPNRTDPVVYYFEKGFPEEFKSMFTAEIGPQTNEVLKEAGAKFEIQFKDWNADGIEREFGDLRYSFVVWHHSIDTTRGLLGYGPSTHDPRTGEVISATVNLYDIGMDYYRFLIQDYLERNGYQSLQAYVAANNLPASSKWEDISCTADLAPEGGAAATRFATGLFEKMRDRLELPYHEDGIYTSSDFLPEITQDKTQFLTNYNRLLNELRFVNPLYNPYVYRTPEESPLARFPARMAKEREFQAQMSRILANQNPFEGTAPYTREGITRQLAFRDQFRDWKKNHDQLQADMDMLMASKCIYTFDANDAISAIAKGKRKCVNGKFESDAAYSDRIVKDVVYHVAIHEFGHTMSLRHNFYGSVDALHQREHELSSSVMDYVTSQEEVMTGHAWGQYDEAALSWIYGTPEVRSERMAEDFLYCTDEHRSTSPLCTAHDLGITPSQIVLNAIERYDLMYELRNRRAYRTFWDTTGYNSAVYNAVFPLQRMWYMALFNWGGGGVQETLKRLDQIAGSPKTDQEYDELSMDYYNDVTQAIGLTMAFYDAIINQDASTRNYQTEYDPYYGDVLRLGIINDKLFATFAFMDLQETYNYDPNIYTYVAMYDAPFGNRNAALSERILDNMLGARYDTFPWFKYYALNIFAYVTNDNMIGNIQLKERVAIRRYNRQADFEAEYGAGALEQVSRLDNPMQIFVKDGQEYVYTYLAERGWHLVASKSRNPVSFQYMRDYNNSLNAGKSDSLDTYGLKVMIAYHEYFNNFSGY